MHPPNRRDLTIIVTTAVFQSISRDQHHRSAEDRPSQQLQVRQMARQLFGWWRTIWVGGLQPGSASSLLFALICVALATFIRVALGELSSASAVFASYYSATLVAALVGGAPAGILAAASGAAAGFWLFVPPDWKSHVFDREQLVSALLFAGSSGVIIWAAKSYRDLLWRLRAEEDQRQLLTHELAHRIRNMLSIVQSLIGQTLRDQPAALAKLNARIGALAATNDLLIKSKWRGAYLTEILAGEFAPYDPARFCLDGDDFECPSEVATVLALIFHELTTNAAKYGALSGTHGAIALAWRNRDGRAEFNWVESGGPQPAASRRQGFGTTLLRKGLRQFDGSVDIEFARGGLRCRFALALPRPRQAESAAAPPRRPHVTLPAAAVESTAELREHVPRPRHAAGRK